MKLSMLISPGIWDLLERLRPHLDVTIDLFDRSLSPLMPYRDDPVDKMVRTLAAGAAASVDSSDRLQAAVRTGQNQVVAVGALRLGLFPIRSDRTVIGLLVTASVVPEEEASGEPVARGATAVENVTDLERRLERLGWSLRATIEADISTHARLSDEEQRSRWLATILRFLEHLYSCPNERELFQTIVEGAAIWGDFDARVYARTLGGQFVLEAALASVVAHGIPRSFPGALLAAHPGVARITSIAELEQVGAGAALGELLVMPLPGADPPQHLFTVSGVVDAHFERVFSVVCRTLGSCVEHLATARARDLHGRLMRRINDDRLRFPAPATTLLADIAAATGATHARLLLGESGQAPRVLAAAGGSALSSLPTEFPIGGSVRRPDRLVVSLDLEQGRPAWLDLGTMATREFTYSDAMLAEAGASVIEVWLAGAMQGLSASTAGHGGLLAPQGFEARLQEEIERARRFNLEAGLLVLGTAEGARDSHALALAPVIEMLRGQLRASDLVGRLSTGEVAALLVHTNAEGVAAVSTRLQRHLSRLGGETGVRVSALGQAAYPAGGDTAAALVRAAHVDLDAKMAPTRPVVPTADSQQN